MAIPRDLTGQRFNHLVAIKPTDKKIGTSIVWLFKCDCGVVCEKVSSYVTSGKTRSCGCLHRKLSSERLRAVNPAALNRARATHGHTRDRKASATYRTWSSMKSRCDDPNHKSYARYGGRGIGYCERWRDFTLFLEDMGERSAGTSLDRIDNDRGYEPTNCRWATSKEQLNNTRVNHTIELDGVVMNIKEWAEKIGCTHQAIGYRLRAGWTVKEALTRPFDHGNGWIRGR